MGLMSLYVSNIPFIVRKGPWPERHYTSFGGKSTDVPSDDCPDQSLSIYNQPADWAALPVSSDMLAICNTSVSTLWRSKGKLAYNTPVGAVPPLGRIRV